MSILKQSEYTLPVPKPTVASIVGTVRLHAGQRVVIMCEGKMIASISEIEQNKNALFMLRKVDFWERMGQEIIVYVEGEE